MLFHFMFDVLFYQTSNLSTHMYSTSVYLLDVVPIYITTHLHCVYMHIIGCVFIYIHMCIYSFSHLHIYVYIYICVCVFAAAQLFRVLPSSSLLNTIGAAQAHQKQPWRSHSNAVSRHWAAKQHRTTCAAATPSAATPAPFARRHTK